MNHQKIYETIILNAQIQNRIKHRGIYYERHHIIPRCLFGLNNKENLVLLTAKEHFVCHKLLTYIYSNHTGLAYAFHRMCYGINSTHQRHYKISSKDYAYCRELIVKNCSGENHPFFGKKHSDATIEKIRKANKGLKQTKSRIEHRVLMSDLVREKTKIKQSNSLKGHIVSSETRLIISKKLSGKKKSDKHIRHIKESHIGIHQLEQTKQKISDKMKIIMKGKSSPNKGKTFSEETKLKMSLAAKKRGISKETQIKMLKSRLQHNMVLI